MKQITSSNNDFLNTTNIVILDDETCTDKTYLVADILSHKKIPIGCAILGNNIEPNNYSKLIPSTYIYNEYNSNIIKNILIRQKKMVRKSNVENRMFLVMDKCFNKSITASNEFKVLFLNNRCFKTTLISIMQYPFHISAIIRNGFDFIFILKNDNYSARKKIYEYYARIFPTLDIFCQIMDQYTDDFNCLVINTNSKSNKLEDMVFRYKIDVLDELYPKYKEKST
jgi:hypothetical protein